VRRWRGILVAMALGVLAVGATASVAGAWSWYSSRQAAAQTSFQQTTSETANDLTLGLSHDADLADTVRAFIVSQPNLTNVEFKRWFMLVGKHAYPDAVAFGYVQLVPARDLMTFVKRAFADPVDPRFRSHSSSVVPGGKRTEYCLARLGVWDLPVALPPTLDLCDTPEGPIMRLAGTSGETLEGSVTQTGQQLVDELLLFVPGHPRRPVLHGPIATDKMLLLFGPVYRNGPATPRTGADRRAELLGWTVSVFDATQLLRSGLGDRSDLRIQLAHKNIDARPVAVVELGSTGRGPLARSTVTLEGGWRLHFVSSVQSGGMTPRQQAAGILAGGFAVSLLIFLLIIALIRSRTRAIELVVEKTKDLQHLAMHDPLTGLPNRTLIFDRAEQMLARARRHDGWPAALFVDLDNFKEVNDTLGHDVGDELLRAAGARVQSAVRSSDTLGRLGGDEFVVLVESDEPGPHPKMVAERILDAFREPFVLESQGGRPIRITASIGIATGDRATAQELLRDADVALYQAKAIGKRRYEVFRTEMRRSITDAVALKSELLAAVEASQFFLVYQPIVDLESLEVTGVEALLRWRHPDRGLLLPADFLPALEESGMIVDVGRLVLQEACAQLSRWRERQMVLSMSVNLSARQLDSDNLVDVVQEALAAHRLSSSSLVVEVTESAIMLDLNQTAKRLRALKALGLKVAIDDFGTGYSSLAYVQQLPVDVLKIDRTFVSRIGPSQHASTLVRSVVDLGLALGLATVAEGIETRVQLDELRVLHAGAGQGYLFSRPVEVGAFEDLVRMDPVTHKLFLADMSDAHLPSDKANGGGSARLLNEPVTLGAE